MSKGVKAVVPADNDPAPHADGAGQARKRKDKETREAEIVEAAFQVFAEHGFAAAKIDDVAARAQVSKGTVYVYFDTKEALFEAVIRTYILASLEKTIASLSVMDMSHEDRLRYVLKRAYTMLAGSDIRKIIAMLVGEGSRFPQLIKFYHDNVMVRARAMTAGIIRAGIEDGAFRDIPVEKFPQVIVGPGMMGAIWAHHFNHLSPINLDELYDAHIDLLLNGLRPRD